MSDNHKTAKDFEDAARLIIERERVRFGMSRVEPAPCEVACASGNFTIEIVGYSAATGKQVLIECKRLSRNVEPETMRGFAYRIEKSGAETGFIVTTLNCGLSRGATEIAEYHKIEHIQLSDGATAVEFVMRHLETFFIGTVERVCIGERVRVECGPPASPSQSSGWVT